MKCPICPICGNDMVLLLTSWYCKIGTTRREHIEYFLDYMSKPKVWIDVKDKDKDEDEIHANFLMRSGINGG